MPDSNKPAIQQKFNKTILSTCHTKTSEENINNNKPCPPHQP